MRLILEGIHGNSKVADLGGWYMGGKQIVICPVSHREGREHFSELYNFFTQALGPSIDIQTLETLTLRPPVTWCYQVDNKGAQHRFFVKNQKDLDWFLLKYSNKLTRWS
jgi:hypothetical protein